MSEFVTERLGPPAIRFAGLQIWIHGRQFPESMDHWDGNWLNVTAHCDQAGASVWATGAILDTIGLLRFRDELEQLPQTLSANRGGRWLLRWIGPKPPNFFATTYNRGGAVRTKSSPTEIFVGE